MAIVLNGNGEISGLSVGGLPDGTVDSDTLATDSVIAAKLGTDSVTADALKDDAIASGDLPTGSVLQVVQASTTTQANQGGSTYSATNLSGTITPTSSSSKILVMVTQYYTYRTTTTSERHAYFRLMRGSTEIQETQADRIAVGSGENRVPANLVFNYLDSPNTTSATTYTTEFKLSGSSTDLYAQHDNAESFITFLEIGA